MTFSPVTLGESSLQELEELARREPGTLFAVLDACDEPRVPEKVKELGDERAVSLYRGWAEEDYWAIAPYLVQVDEVMLQWIVENLWDTPWGIFAVAQTDLAKLRTHFRRFLKVLDPDGKELYFRFYDPRVLPEFLATCSLEEIGRFFGPIENLLCPAENTRLVAIHLSGKAEATVGMQTFLNANISTASPRNGAMRIRHEQRDSLAHGVLARFVVHAVEHLRSQFPAVWANLSDVEADSAVRAGVARAMRVGFELEPQILRFLEVLTCYGPDFGDPDRDLLPIHMLHDPEIVGDWPANRRMILAVREIPS